MFSWDVATGRRGPHTKGSYVLFFFAEYRPNSIKPVLPKVFERLLAVRFQRYLESGGFFPTCQIAYHKGLGTCGALLSISQFRQEALEVGGECCLVQIDFSAAFDRVNHNGLIYRLQSVGVGGAIVLGTINQFLRGRFQKVVVEGVPSRSIPVVSGVPQGSVLGPLLFLLYTAELTDIVENNFVTYAEILLGVAVVPSPRDSPRVIASMNRDLALIDGWCIGSGTCWLMLAKPRHWLYLAPWLIARASLLLLWVVMC